MGEQARSIPHHPIPRSSPTPPLGEQRRRRSLPLPPIPPSLQPSVSFSLSLSCTRLTKDNFLFCIGVSLPGAGAGPANKMPLFCVGVSLLGAAAGPVDKMPLILACWGPVPAPLTKCHFLLAFACLRPPPAPSTTCRFCLLVLACWEPAPSPLTKCLCFLLAFAGGASGPLALTTPFLNGQGEGPGR